MKSFLTFLTSIVLLIPFCNSQNLDHSFKESYPIISPAQFTLSCVDGNAEVIGSEVQEIQVFYVVKRNNDILTINRRELEKEVSVVVAYTKNSLSISLQYFKKHLRFFAKDPLEVNLKVYVPKNTACNLKASDGTIAVKELASDVQCKTSDGTIQISKIKGNVAAKTSDGTVYIKGIQGSVTVNSSDGNIYLEDILGKLKAKTSDGSVELINTTGETVVSTSDGNTIAKRISGSLEVTSSSGGIRGSIASLTGPLILKTGEGNIDLTIPKNIGLDLRIKGEFLDVPLTNFSGKSEEQFIKGQANGGGFPVDLSSNAATVSLRYE